MKKLALLFACLSLFIATGCNNDDEETPMEYPLNGVWQPIKKVVTTVATGQAPVSDGISFDSECQKTSRWTFENGVGKRKEFGDSATPGTCNITFDRNFTYTYDKDSKAIQIKYQGIVMADQGKIVTLSDTTLNLMIEDKTDPTKFRSETYTFKRIVTP
ncbi:lipocalin family protein [Chryseobacterium sp. GMJ5]|uniref:Lipocalin family protein n=1 Tax=Chryseobacterium gilvum TaxID=2976534 RepID=A0ABT2VZI3_9FLAO|nr:lipocalin family protein [Chryseobacterium gilvum]MCU7615414.1 lipocalin family protein [Chryseobacterium gilvum]